MFIKKVYIFPLHVCLLFDDVVQRKLKGDVLHSIISSLSSGSGVVKKKQNNPFKSSVY